MLYTCVHVAHNTGELRLTRAEAYDKAPRPFTALLHAELTRRVDAAAAKPRACVNLQ